MRPPDYAAGIALGTAHGLVSGWFVVAAAWLLLFFRDSRLTGDQVTGAILVAAFLLGAAWGAVSTRRISRLPNEMRERTSGKFSPSIVQVSWFCGGAMLGALAQGIAREMAEGLSRYFGWPLHTDPSFGTYDDAPALSVAAFLVWIPTVYIAWIRWQRGPRAFAVGLGLVSLLVLVGLVLS
jgi:hypothetical protein